MVRALRIVLIAGVLVGLPAMARADVVLLLGEPYGPFATFSPTGHAAVYLTDICAETPTALRHCRPGEIGAVVSRYHRVGGRDWIAIPLLPYLYGVEEASAVPASANAATVLTLRDRYRRKYLADLVQDAPGGEMPKGDWIQLVGAVYDRSIVAFSLRTSREQDEQLLQLLNAWDNTRRFNLFLRNCADFAQDILNTYFAQAVRSNAIADLGLTTPKQLARSVVDYASRRPDVGLQAFLIPQIAGSRPSSRRARGVMEGLFKTKKYAVPLAVVQPWVPVGLAAGYVAFGRFDPHRYANDVFEPSVLEARARELRNAESSRDGER